MLESTGPSRPSAALPRQPEPRSGALLPPPLQRLFRDTQTGEESADLLALRPGRQLDPSGLADLLAHGYQVGLRTPILGVERVLQPWFPAAPAVHPCALPSLEERADHLWCLLVAAVRDAVPAGARVRVSLSGGLDSRAVAAAASSLGLKGLRASTFGDPGCPDLAVSHEVASGLGLDHERSILIPDAALQHEDRVWRATGGAGGPQTAPGAPTDEGWARDFDLLLSGTSGDVIWGDTRQPGPTPARRLARLGLAYVEPRWDQELPGAPGWMSTGGVRAWRNLWTRQQGATWNGVLPRLAHCRVVPIPWSEDVLAFCLALGDEDRLDRLLLRTMLRRHAPQVSDLVAPPVRGAQVHDLNRAWRTSPAWRHALEGWVSGARKGTASLAFEATGLRRREVRRLVKQVLGGRSARAPFLGRVRAVWRWGL